MFSALESDGVRIAATASRSTLKEVGHFTIVDRMKDMILTAGFNVYPAEIERILCGHPALQRKNNGQPPDRALMRVAS